MKNIFLTVIFIYSFVVCRKINAYHFNKCDVNLNSDSKILDTLNGKIKGECYTVPVTYSNGSKTTSNVMNWLSVPYAEPPINEKRFKKSVQKQPWSNTIDGTSWPKHCVQFFLPNGTEDCLYLNIFVKSDVYMNRNKTLVPILFFIHGGGLVSGGISVDFYEGSTLAAYGEIVVVTIQYRLDSFGFLHLANSFASGDQGFLDQHLALKWVYENAEKFGGDRNKITISGESAGAISVGYHLLYEKSWPYFRNAIMESGGPNFKTISLISSNEAENRSKELLYFLGCDKNISNSELLNCAQKLDANLILNATFKYLRNKIFKKEIYSLLSGTHFPLVINNETFKEPIEKIIEKKNVKKCKIITGFNSGEFGLSVPGIEIANLGPDPSKWEENAKAINSTVFADIIENLFHYYPRYPLLKNETFVTQLLNEYSISLEKPNSYIEVLIKIFSDFLFICPSFEMAEVYTKLGQEAFVYYYEHIISSSIYPKIFGAVHTDELPMMFAEILSNKKAPLISDNYWSSAFHNYFDDERKFNENFLNYWINFVKHDDPNYSLNSGLSAWSSFINNSQMKVNGFSDVGRFLSLRTQDIKMNTGFSSHKCVFWNYTRLTNGAARVQKKIYLFIILFINLVFKNYCY